MLMTNVKPTKPGWYWFLRSGSGPHIPHPVRVYQHKGHLCYHVGEWPGSAWAENDRMSDADPRHRWSDEALPTPSNWKRV